VPERARVLAVGAAHAHEDQVERGQMSMDWPSWPAAQNVPYPSSPVHQCAP
jgi:hypothetical protein